MSVAVGIVCTVHLIEAFMHWFTLHHSQTEQEKVEPLADKGQQARTTLRGQS